MGGVYVCADPGVPVYGSKGSSVHVQAVLRALAKRVPMRLCAVRVDGEAPAGLEGVPVEELGRPSGKVAERERLLVRLDERMYEAIVSDPGAEFVYERFSLWATAGMRAAEALGVPGVLEVNAPLLEEQTAHRELVDHPEAERRARRAIQGATHVLAVSAPVREWALQMGADPERTHVVRNAVDPSRFGPAPERDGEDFVVGFLGTLKPWHGLSTLLEAFAAAAELHWRLLVVGDGPERDALQRQAAELGVTGQVEFVGAVQPQEVPNHLARMHVGTAPYAAAEAYFSPLKVYEYLAAGVCVVAARSGEIPEVLGDGRAGLLHEPGDAAGLAATLRRVEADESLRQELSRRGREAASRHTWDDVADQVLRLVEGG